MVVSSSKLAAAWSSKPDADLKTHDVEGILRNISDDVWVAAACVDRIVASVDVERALLSLGLERTDKAVERCQEGSSASTSTEKPPVLDLGSTDAQLCYYRLILVTRLERLDTYVEILANEPAETVDSDTQTDEWEDDPWGEDEQDSSKPLSSPNVQFSIDLPSFLTQDLLDIAQHLALLQNLTALKIIWSRHGDLLWPYRFSLIERIPEHTEPSLYHFLLPSLPSTGDIELLNAPSSRKAELDWVEIQEVQAVLLKMEPEQHTPIPKVSSAGNSVTALSSSELTNWYLDRVSHIIDASGSVDVALSTVQFAVSQGVLDLDQLGEELSLLSRLVYDASRTHADIGEDWTLERWRSMGPSDVVAAYLSHSSSEQLAQDITRLVMPYLFVLEARSERSGQPDPELPKRLIHDYILNAPLGKTAAIFEASKPTLPVSKRIIRDDEEMARLALACLYASKALDEWATMSRIFECLPAWNIDRDPEDEKEVTDTTITSLAAFLTPSVTRPVCTATDLLMFFNPLPLTALSRSLDILDVHLESGEILSRWGVPAPLGWFLQGSQSATEQRAWAHRLVRRVGGEDDRVDSQDDWEWLLEDMLKLCGTGENGIKGALGLLSRGEVVRIYFSGLLSTGAFDVARELLRTRKGKLKLRPDTIEDICISVSREMYDNASSGNNKVGEMKYAYDCLDVASPSPAIIAEKEFIEATSKISAYNVMSNSGAPITPIEIRLTKDRLSLVSRVLSSNEDAYKHTEVILDLVNKLGFKDDAVAEVKTLAMLTDTALQAEDFDRAFESSQRMVDAVWRLKEFCPLGQEDPRWQEAAEVCWVSCYQLGRQPEFNDVPQKMLLLGRALELCPPDQIYDILSSWKRVEAESVELGIEGQTKLSNRERGPTRGRVASSSLRSRLQDFYIPSPPLLNTPDAAALASRTFRSVTANFHFPGSPARSVHSPRLEQAGDRSSSRPPGDDVSAQASRVFSKGIGWLIGADAEGQG